MSLPTFERVAELFEYDDHTGNLLHKTNRRTARIGDIAGSAAGKGYLQVKIDGRKFSVHRIVWLLSTGEWPERDIDHIDRNRLNNRFSNLRDVPPAINNTNRPAYGQTGIKGVRTKGSRFVARIADNGLNRYLGLFETAEEAATAFKIAHVGLWGIDSEFFEEVHVPHPALVELAAQAIERRRTQLRGSPPMDGLEQLRQLSRVRFTQRQHLNVDRELLS